MAVAVVVDIAVALTLTVAVAFVFFGFVLLPAHVKRFSGLSYAGLGLVRLDSNA